MCVCVWSTRWPLPTRTRSHPVRPGFPESPPLMSNASCPILSVLFPPQPPCVPRSRSVPGSMAVCYQYQLPVLPLDRPVPKHVLSRRGAISFSSSSSLFGCANPRLLSQVRGDLPSTCAQRRLSPSKVVHLFNSSCLQNLQEFTPFQIYSSLLYS